MLHKEISKKRRAKVMSLEKQLANQAKVNHKVVEAAAKPAKKTTAKKAPAKKTAEPAPAPKKSEKPETEKKYRTLDGESKVKTLKDFDPNVFKGHGKNIRYERAKRIKDGMTVAEFAEVCQKTEACAGGGRGFLMFLQEKGVISIACLLLMLVIMGSRPVSAQVAYHNGPVSVWVIDWNPANIAVLVGQPNATPPWGLWVTACSSDVNVIPQKAVLVYRASGQVVTKMEDFSPINTSGCGSALFVNVKRADTINLLVVTGSVEFKDVAREAR
jgi:hypothetical protein